MRHDLFHQMCVCVRMRVGAHRLCLVRLLRKLQALTFCKNFHVVSIVNHACHTKLIWCLVWRPVPTGRKSGFLNGIDYERMHLEIDVVRGYFSFSSCLPS